MAGINIAQAYIQLHNPQAALSMLDKVEKLERYDLLQHINDLREAAKQVA